MGWPYILGIISIAVILYLFGSLRVLRQYERGVVFFLGKFEGVRGPGITLIFIPIQQMVRVSLRTVTMQIPSQKIITKDNVSIDIAAVAYYHISDPEKAVIVIENVYEAINQISQTTVRNVVGRFSLDQLLSDTASINEQIKNVIDGHTEPWGTQVTAVEIKDIVLPDNMQRAMAKEAEAERERRAKIVAAEGEYQAAVKLGQAADIITQHPVALQLRTLQTMAEPGVRKRGCTSPKRAKNSRSCAWANGMRAPVRMQPFTAPVIDSSTDRATKVPPIGPIVRVASSEPTRSVAAISGTVITRM